MLCLNWINIAWNWLKFQEIQKKKKNETKQNSETNRNWKILEHSAREKKNNIFLNWNPSNWMATNLIRPSFGTKFFFLFFVVPNSFVTLLTLNRSTKHKVYTKSLVTWTLFVDWKLDAVGEPIACSLLWRCVLRFSTPFTQHTNSLFVSFKRRIPLSRLNSR